MKIPWQKKDDCNLERKKPAPKSSMPNIEYFTKQNQYEEKIETIFSPQRSQQTFVKHTRFFHFSQTRNRCPYTRCMCSKINNHNILFTEKG